MYGLVNQAVQGLVVSRYGEETWQEIRSRAGIETDVFLSMEPYDDAITYGLVGAASEVLEIEPESVLFAFGEYWVLETAKKSYAELMEAAGSTLPEFLGNLDQLHSRLQATFPNLSPPSFRVEMQEPGSLRLHYYSEREGLEPFVAGLVSGLGTYFGVPVEAMQVPLEQTDGGDHAEFIVRYGSGPG